MIKNNREKTGDKVQSIGYICIVNQRNEPDMNMQNRNTNTNTNENTTLQCICFFPVQVCGQKGGCPMDAARLHRCPAAHGALYLNASTSSGVRGIFLPNRREPVAVIR